MIACVVIPFFATAVERRLHPTLSDELLVLSDNTRTVRRVAAVSRQAAELDIRQGMVLRHAQTLVPELSALPLNPPHYRQNLEELRNTLCTFADRVEVAYKGWGSGDEKTLLSAQSAASSLNPAVAFVDIGSLKPKSLFDLGQQLQKALAFHHLSTRIGIASNRFTAWVAALTTREGEITFVNKGEEKWMLTCHPVSLLPLDDKTLRRLWWLSIHTLGDFAALPSAAIRPQFGKQGQTAYQLAQGIDKTPVQKVTREREVSRSFVFEGAVSDRQVMTAALNKLTKEFVTSLEASAQTARKLRLTLNLEDRGACEFEARLRRRTHTPAQFQNALQALLDKAKISAPVTEISVTLGDLVALAAQQLELFPSMRLVENRQAVLDDLVTRYGERFFTAAITDEQSLLPEFQAEFKVIEIA